ncbi:T1SS secreted agglutinin RTX, partial [Olavius sp. associated proteobacterium Delta 1]
MFRRITLKKNVCIPLLRQLFICSWLWVFLVLFPSQTVYADAPVANPDTATVAEGGTVSVLESTETSVLANDTDAEGDTLTAALVSDVSHGTLVLNAADGTFSYTHDGSKYLIDSFTYKALDASLESAAAKVTIRINPHIALRWDKNPESDLAGYRLYYKTGAPVDDRVDPDLAVIDIPKESLADEDNPTYTVEGLDATQVHFFAVTAYDDSISVNESYFSNGASTLRITKPGEGFFVNGEMDYTKFQTEGRGIPGTSVEVFANDIQMEVNDDDVKDDGAWINYLDFSGVSQGEINLTVVYNGITSFPVKGIYDIIAPLIELDDPAPAVTDKKDSYAILQWETNEPAFGTVEYGLDENYGGIETSEVLTTNHRVIITGLAADTEYHFRVSAEDAAGNGPDSSSEDTNPSSDYSFRTDPPAAPSIAKYPYLGPDFIEITFDKPNLLNAGLETSYSFNPALLFNTTEDESDDIIEIDDFSYRLLMRDIPHYEIFILTVINIADSVGQSIIPPTVTINDNDQDSMADDWEAEYGLDSENDDSGQDPDGDGNSNYQEYLARTHPRNDAPVAAADAVTVDEGETVSVLDSGQGSVLANDSDAEGDALTAVLVSGPVHAADFSLNADGRFSYTHDGSETSADSFSYQAQDTEPRAGDPVTVSITVTAVNDAPVATDGGFTVAEDAVSGVVVGTMSAFDNDGDLLTYTIKSINALPVISIDNVTVTEGDTGSINATFTATLSAAVSREVSVEYATSDGTAEAGNDYEPLAGTLTFDAGIRTKTMEVLVYGDVTDEANETFFVNLTNAVNAVIADPEGRATISDNDGPAGIPAGGLVAAYSFDEGSGTTVVDSSGNGNTGVISGAGWTAEAKFGKALSFDGVNDWVTVNDANVLDLSTGVTLEAWVYPTEPLSGRSWATVIIKGAALYYLAANSDLDTPSTGIIVGGYRDLYGILTLPANNWAHLAGTYDGVNQRLFIDGVEVTSRAQIGEFETSDGPLHFGGNSVWGEFFPGMIDEIRVYNRALSVTEIQADMNTPVEPLSQDIPLMLIEDVALEETDTLSVNAVFTVTLSAVSQDEVTVSYSTIDGTASAGSDYLPSSGILTFAPGTTTQVISVAVNGDVIDEENETFFVQLSAAVNADIGDPAGRAMIIDDYEGGNFVIDGGTGDIYIADNNDLDYETATSYMLTVEVEDSGLPPLNNTAMITVDVTDVNESPAAVDDNVATDEDTAVTVNVLANDSDVDGDGLSVVAVTDPAKGTAAINEDSSVSYTPEADFFGSDSFTYTISDGELTATGTVTVSMSAVNDAPADITLSNNSINENLPPGTLVGTFTSTDADAGDSHTYSLASTGAGDIDWLFFTIAGNELSARVTLDYEAKSFYSLLVITEDQSGEIFEKPFTIVVNNVNNEAPLGITLTNSAISENQPAGATVGTFLTTDQDIGQIHLYSLAAGLDDDDNALFTISNDELRTAASFDFETKSTCKIRVKTDDQHGGAFEGKLTITVIDANDAPVALDDTVSTSADTPVIIEVLANDSDADGDGLSVTGVSQAANGTVTDNGDNTVTYTPNADLNGQETFTYQISDGQGGSVTATVNVTVYAAQYTLTWEPSQSPDVVGYYVHIGTAPRDYTQTIDVGNVTSYNIWLAEKFVTYYFSVTAYDSGGQGIDFFKPELSARVIDDMHILTSTNYEDAWNPTVSGWTVYDNEPAGAVISNVYDADRGSRVIELSGSGLNNGYQLRKEDGNPWLDSSRFVIEWSMQYSEKFEVFIEVRTTAGQ